MRIYEGLEQVNKALKKDFYFLHKMLFKGTDLQLVNNCPGILIMHRIVNMDNGIIL